MIAFVNFLSELLPGKNLAEVLAKKARKILKVMNAAKFGIFGAIVVLVLNFAFIFRKAFFDIKNNMIIVFGIIVIFLVIAFFFYLSQN